MSQCCSVFSGYFGQLSSFELSYKRVNQGFGRTFIQVLPDYVTIILLLQRKSIIMFALRKIQRRNPIWCETILTFCRRFFFSSNKCNITVQYRVFSATLLEYQDARRRRQRRWNNETYVRRQKEHVNMIWNLHDLGVVVPHVRLYCFIFRLLTGRGIIFWNYQCRSSAVREDKSNRTGRNMRQKRKKSKPCWG